MIRGPETVPTELLAQYLGARLRDELVAAPSTQLALSDDGLRTTDCDAVADGSIV